VCVIKEMVRGDAGARYNRCQQNTSSAHQSVQYSTTAAEADILYALETMTTKMPFLPPGMRGVDSALSVYWVRGVVQEEDRLIGRTVCIQDVGGILVLEYHDDNHIRVARGMGDRQAG
jgi:hypothetical protein